MLATFFSEHWSDTNDKPAGGVSSGTGFTISWQNGPLNRGPDRKDPNGAFVETVLAAVADRIQFYNSAGYQCDENDQALHCIAEALKALNSRTSRRETAGVEGTHEGN